MIENMIDALWQDTRYTLRLVRLSPGFAIVAIVSIALGTGAPTAIFQLLDAISLRSLPVKAPQELVELRLVRWVLEYFHNRRISPRGRAVGQAPALL